MVNSLMRWEPFREIESLQREMNRLFDKAGHQTGGIAFVPAAELHEAEDAVYLKLELPGMNAEDLDIQVTAEAISISGERKSETKTENNFITRSEFSMANSAALFLSRLVSKTQMLWQNTKMAS